MYSGVGLVDRAVNPVLQSAFTPDPAASANPLQLVVPVLALVWAVGVAVLAAYTAFSWLGLRRRLAQAVLLRDNIYQSERVVSPFVFGLARPGIYLPFSLDLGTMEHVIAHEQAHITRRDHWWKPLGFAITAVYWFNPLLWVAYFLFCRDIELACDERVVRGMDPARRADYAQALLRCSAGPRRLAACPLAFGEADVKNRVKQALYYKKPAFWVVLAAVLLCAGAAVAFLTDPPGPRYDLSQNPISRAVVWDYSAPAMQELPGGQWEELTARLEGMQGFSRTEESLTPLYELVIQLEDGTLLDFSGYREDGSQVCTEYEGEWWQVEDQEFGAYLYGLWQEVRRAEDRPKDLAAYAEALAATVTMKEEELLFTLPQALPTGAQLTLHLAGRAEYADGFSQSLHFLEDEDWTPGKRYSVPYDPAYTSLDLFLSAQYEDGRSEEQSLDLLGTAQAKLLSSAVPALTNESADAFIADILASFTLNRDGSFSYTLPGPIPEAEDGKTRIAVRLNASFSTGASSDSVQSLEYGPQELAGKETVTGRLELERGELAGVAFTVSFETELGPDARRQYAGRGIELVPPFRYGQPAGYAEPTVGGI